jgi:DNA repair exonuclease SbcCD ATPase subunit
MGTSSALPQKQDLPKEIWRVATTLTDDAQNAAMRKARELGFDLNRGRIPLEETLINLSLNRDILLDAADKNKLVQLPLKLQYNLLAQTQKVSESLTALANGTDALLTIEDSVEDLTSIVWQYNLRNLSEEVLGFHSKMNQLKVLETAIRKAHREAEEFGTSSSRAQDLLAQIDEVSRTTVEIAKSTQSAVEQVSTTLARVQEQEQKVAALTIQAQQQDSSAAQYAANAKTASADVEAIATKTRGLQSEFDAARTELAELTTGVRHLLTTTEDTLSNSIHDLERRFDEVKSDADTQTNTLREKLNASTDELVRATEAKVDILTQTIEAQSTELDESVKKLATDTNARLMQAEATQQSHLNTQLTDFNQRTTASAEEQRTALETKLAEITDKSDKVLAASDAEFKRLASQLDELEGRIKVSIERATGFTLFHSFQKRQMDLAKSKKYWAIALACAVGVSLAASTYFIHTLSSVTTYNAAFYLKLSVSLPIIYAIAFCSVQFARERRLEEEYAFKSSISISLDPYQKLVAQLVDQNKPDELAKYTGFVIDSINRVFTSPTESVFSEHPGDKNSAEKIIKAVGDVIEPLAKALKK